MLLEMIKVLGIERLVIKIICWECIWDFWEILKKGFDE